MSLLFEVPEEKKLRVIIDTDAAREADDPFAIVHALLSPKLMVKGILAEHFREEGSMERSYEEIRVILEAMDMDVPFFKGQRGPMDSGSGEEPLSEGVQFIIEEALKEEEHPLYILCQGAVTNVAAAMKACPAILSRMTVIWIGTHGEAPKRAPFREFNAGNDIEAANYLLSAGGNLWIVPSGVYATIHIGIAEIQRRILPCGKIGKHLFWNLVKYNMSEFAGWTKGESWSLGDSPAVAVALNPDCGHYREVPAPYVAEDTSSVEAYTVGSGSAVKMADEENSDRMSDTLFGNAPESSAESADGKPAENRAVKLRPTVRMYTDVDSRYILEDLIAKLELTELPQDDEE